MIIIPSSELSDNIKSAIRTNAQYAMDHRSELIYSPGLYDSAQAVSEDTLRMLLRNDPVTTADGNSLKYDLKNANPIYTKILHHLVEMVPDKSIVPSGQFWYPPGGYMGWHTNHDAPYTRMYITYVDEPNKSCFRYYDKSTDEVVTSWDDEEFTIRVFDTPLPPAELWHCVYSECNRFSYGYRLTPYKN